MTLTPSPSPARRARRTLLAALVTLVAMALVVLGGVAADAGFHGGAVLGSAPALSGPAHGVAPESGHDPASLQAADALDADDLTAPRTWTSLPVPEAIVAAHQPARAAAPRPRPDPAMPERPPRA